MHDTVHSKEAEDGGGVSQGKMPEAYKSMAGRPSDQHTCAISTSSAREAITYFYYLAVSLIGALLSSNTFQVNTGD